MNRYLAIALVAIVWSLASYAMAKFFGRKRDLEQRGFALISLIIVAPLLGLVFLLVPVESPYLGAACIASGGTASLITQWLLGKPKPTT